MNVPMLARQLKATCESLITFQFCCRNTYPELATAIEFRTEQTFLQNEDLCFSNEEVNNWWHCVINYHQTTKLTAVKKY